MERITTNVGIGDLLHTAAILDSLPGPFAVAPSDYAITSARTAAYRPFVRTLCEVLFKPPKYELSWASDGRGQTPQELLLRFGIKSHPCPDITSALGLSPMPADVIAVTTKIRGWQRSQYDAIRQDFVAALRGVAGRHRLVLVGEREIDRTPEYEEHGEDKVYSIYEDLAFLPNMIDLTVQALGLTPPSWWQFVNDCAVMAASKATIALGSGGNLSMALACGRAIGMIAGTEMGEFLSSMDTPTRHRLCYSATEVLEAVRSL